MRSGYIGGEHLEQERTEGIYGKSRMGENGGVPYFIITAYIAVMTAAGYLIATPAALYVLTTMFAGGGSSTLKGRLLFSVAVAVIIYVIYVYAFGLTLPSGMLFE